MPHPDIRGFVRRPTVNDKNPLNRLSPEIFIKIEKLLDLTSHCALALTCKRYYARMGSTVFYFLQRNRSIEEKVLLLHILKRDIPGTWVCYRCFSLHKSTRLLPGLWHPGMVGPVIPPRVQHECIVLKDRDRTGIPRYGFPYCSAIYLNDIIRACSTPDHVTLHESFFRTMVKGKRVGLETDFDLSTLENGPVLLRARHSIVMPNWQPRSDFGCLDALAEMRLDVCQHVRLSPNQADRGNLLLGMVRCSAGGQVAPVGHGDCFAGAIAHKGRCVECATDFMVDCMPLRRFDGIVVMRIIAWHNLSQPTPVFSDAPVITHEAKIRGPTQAQFEARVGFWKRLPL